MRSSTRKSVFLEHNEQNQHHLCLYLTAGKQHYYITISELLWFLVCLPQCKNRKSRLISKRCALAVSRLVNSNMCIGPQSSDVPPHVNVIFPDFGPYCYWLFTVIGGFQEQESFISPSFKWEMTFENHHMDILTVKHWRFIRGVLKRCTVSDSESHTEVFPEVNSASSDTFLFEHIRFSQTDLLLFREGKY